MDEPDPVATPELDLTPLERQVLPLLGQPIPETASKLGISIDQLCSAMASLTDKSMADPSPSGTDEARLLDHLRAEHGLMHQGEPPPGWALLMLHGLKHAIEREALLD